MAKKIMRAKTFPPLFDLTQDIIERLPTDIIKNWIDSDRTHEAAKKILEPTIVRGTNVPSDSSGLSKLSQQMGLVEVMSIVSVPKEIIYSHGKALGGRGIGIWAADNTQMFYPEEVSVQDILSMILAVQEKIKQISPITVGLGAHLGEFYDLGGGLYGEEADFIESVTEGSLAGGETAVSDRFLNKIKDLHLFDYALRKDIEHPMGQIFTVTSGPKIAEIEAGDTFYPIPYSEEFYLELKKYDQTKDEKLLAEIYNQFAREKTVVLVERSREHERSHEATLLNDLAFSGAMVAAALETLKKIGGEEIKTVGSLGIYVFDDSRMAVEFSREFKKLLLEKGIESKIGIEKGEVLIFTLKNKTKDIAGSPVNIASKMAQDKGEFGKIYITKQAAEGVDKKDFKPLGIEVSHITIEAFWFE